MTKFYVGYTQGNGEYVYVSSIDTTVRVSVITDTAMGFTTKELATNLLNIAKSLVANQDFKVLEVTTEIKEVK